MKPLGRTRKHFWLAQRMARGGGIDLAREAARGTLDQAGWAEMVRRCRGCRWSGGCERFLARNARFEALPDSCPNKAAFERLRDANGKEDAR